MLGRASMTVGVLGRAGAPPKEVGKGDSEALCRGMGRRRLGVAAVGLRRVAGVLSGARGEG